MIGDFHELGIYRVRFGNQTTWVESVSIYEDDTMKGMVEY